MTDAGAHLISNPPPNCDAAAPSVMSSFVPYLSSQEFILSFLVVSLTIIALCLIYALLRRRDVEPNAIMRLFVLVLIIGATLELVAGHRPDIHDRVLQLVGERAVGERPTEEVAAQGEHHRHRGRLRHLQQLRRRTRGGSPRPDRACRAPPTDRRTAAAVPCRAASPGRGLSRRGGDRHPRPDAPASLPTSASRSTSVRSGSSSGSSEAARLASGRSVGTKLTDSQTARPRRAQARDQAGAHHRGLAAARRADDGDERTGGRVSSSASR